MRFFGSNTKSQDLKAKERRLSKLSGEPREPLSYRVLIIIIMLTTIIDVIAITIHSPAGAAAAADVDDVELDDGVNEDHMTKNLFEI